MRNLTPRFLNLHYKWRIRIGDWLWRIFAVNKRQCRRRRGYTSFTTCGSYRKVPELPEEEWEYIKTLPGYEVEVESKSKKIDKRYLMQCASFRTRAQAEEMKAKIAFQGLERLSDTALAATAIGSALFWALTSRRDAEKAKHSLRKVNIATCQIWYWNL